MKHRASFVIACWWVILLTMVGGFLLVYAPRKARVSETENRMLAGAPELSLSSVASGEFMEGFDSWLTDSFFARDSVISLSETILAKGAFGERQASVEERLENELMPEEAEPEIIAAAPERTPIPEVEPIDYTKVDDGEPSWEDEEEDADGEDWMAFYLKKTDGTVEKLYNYSDRNVETVANVLNAYREVLPADGTVHYMIIPFSASAYRWLNNRNKYCGWASNVEEEIQKQVASGVYIHNIPALFEKQLDEGEYLYFRLDHHWTPKAAWEVVSEMMSAQGYPTVGYNEYNYTVHKDFYGSEYDASDRDTMRKMVDALELMHPLLPARHYLVSKLTSLKESVLMDYSRKKYTAFMGGTRGPWRLMDTGYSTGRTALVICDSFGTSLAPYLLPYYDQVLMTDFRPDYYEAARAGGTVKQYVDQYGVDDVYMILSMVSGPIREYTKTYLMQYLK